MTSFSFQAHHDSPESSLDSAGANLRVWYQNLPADFWDSASNRTALFEDPEVAARWSAMSAHLGIADGLNPFGQNAHPNGNSHAGLRAFFDAERADIFRSDNGLTEIERKAAFQNLLDFSDDVTKNDQNLLSTTDSNLVRQAYDNQFRGNLVDPQNVS